MTQYHNWSKEADDWSVIISLGDNQVTWNWSLFGITFLQILSRIKRNWSLTWRETRLPGVLRCLCWCPGQPMSDQSTRLVASVTSQTFGTSLFKLILIVSVLSLQCNATQRSQLNVRTTLLLSSFHSYRRHHGTHPLNVVSKNLVSWPCRKRYIVLIDHKRSHPVVSQVCWALLLSWPHSLR